MPFSFRPFTLRLLAAGACACALVPACTKKSDSPIDQCGYAQWSDQLLLSNAAGASIVGQCMARAPDIDANSLATCIVLEGTKSPSCTCASPGLKEIPGAHLGAVDDAKQHSGAETFTCFCEVEQLTDDAAHACRFSEDEKPTLNGKSVDGYCYLDPAQKLGDPKLVEKCNDTEQHLLRFVGDVTKQDGQGLFIYCSASLCGSSEGGS